MVPNETKTVGKLFCQLQHTFVWSYHMTSLECMTYKA